MALDSLSRDTQWRPHSFSHEDSAIDTPPLQSRPLFEAAVPELASRFSLLLRAEVSLSLQTTDAAPSDLPSKPFHTSVLADSEIAGSNDRIVFGIDTGLLFAMIERLLGGTIVVPAPVRPLTGIETRITLNLYSEILAALARAWSSTLPMQFREPHLVPAFGSRPLPHESMQQGRYELSVGESTGILEVGVPAGMTFSKAPGGAAPAIREDSISRPIPEVLKHCPVAVEAVFGELKLTIRDILQLAVGDVIPLRSKENDLVAVHVAGRPRFWGHVLRDGDDYQVRVVHVMPDVHD